MKKEEKSVWIDELSVDLQKSTSIFFTEFRGLKIPELDELRKRLRTVPAKYSVVKNTLAAISSKNCGIPQIRDLFIGPSGIIFGFNDDPGSLSKLILTYAKEHPQFKVRAAFIEKQTLSAEQVKLLSNLPGKPVLLAQTVGTLKYILTRLVLCLNDPVRKLVTVLDAYKAKTE